MRHRGAFESAFESAFASAVEVYGMLTAMVMGSKNELWEVLKWYWPCVGVQDARCIFAIHNLSHQGVEPAASFGNFGLPDDWCILYQLSPV